MNAPISSLGIIVSLLRASAMPLAVKCPGSIRNTEIRINASNEAADAATAAHILSRQLPENGRIDFEQCDIVAAQCGCDADELRYLCACATKLWAKVKDSYPRALTEIAVDYPLEISGLSITGTMDGIAIFGDYANLYDWKFGRLDTDYYEQMMAYASMVLKRFPHLTHVNITILWARTQEAETYTVTREAADEWMRKIEAEVVNWDGTYHPSEKCIHCPRYYECPAANSLTRACVASISNVDVDSIAEQIASMPADQLIQLRRQAKVVEHIAGVTNEAIRNLLLKRGEIVGSQAMLTLESQPRREAEPTKTWEAAEEAGLTWFEFTDAVKVSLTKLEKMIKEKAGKGFGAEAIRKFKAKLEQRGAVSFTDTLKVIERRL